MIVSAEGRENECFQKLSFLRQRYPEFEAWFHSKVLPGLARGTRMMEVDVQDGEVVGIVIAKRESDELKLCTAWVREDFRGRGIGVRLIRRAMEWLGTDRPLASLNGDGTEAMQNLLQKMGFLKTSERTLPDGRSEIYYNEINEDMGS